MATPPSTAGPLLSPLSCSLLDSCSGGRTCWPRWAHSTLGHGRNTRSHLGGGTAQGQLQKAWLAIRILLGPVSPANLLTWVTRLTVAADQATPTNRLAALPKGNLY